MTPEAALYITCGILIGAVVALFAVALVMVNAANQDEDGWK